MVRLRLESYNSQITEAITLYDSSNRIPLSIKLGKAIPHAPIFYARIFYEGSLLEFRSNRNSGFLHEITMVSVNPDWIEKGPRQFPFSVDEGYFSIRLIDSEFDLSHPLKFIYGDDYLTIDFGASESGNCKRISESVVVCNSKTGDLLSVTVLSLDMPKIRNILNI